MEDEPHPRPGAHRRVFPDELTTQTLWVRVPQPWLGEIAKRASTLAMPREEVALDLIIRALKGDV